MKKSLFTVVLFLLGASMYSKTIGIISALDFESSFLKSKLQNPKIDRYFSRDYYSGKIGNNNVVIVQVGVGIVNSSVGTALLIDKFKPDEIILVGVAGSTDKSKPADIILGSRVTFYDFGKRTADGKFSRMPAPEPAFKLSDKDPKLNPLFYKGDSQILNKLSIAGKDADLKDLSFKGKVYTPEVVTGIITTTQTFNEDQKLAKKMMNETGCIAFEMEGAGAAQVCYDQKVLFVMVKAISDNGNFEMFNALKDEAAENAEKVVLNYLSK